MKQYILYDGNGRTGRIILLLYLKLSGLLELPHHKTQYYAHLRKVTEENDWIGWILYMLEMIEKTALKGRQQIYSIDQLMTTLGKEIQEKLPKIYSKDLMEQLFKLPYTKRTYLQNAGLGNLKTVGNYLKILEDAGFLKAEQVGKEKLYLNFRLLDILKRQAN